MEITDMILVTENYKGTETNYLMDVQDYLAFIEKDSDLSRSELAENMCELGRTLGAQKDWAEIYYAANKTVSARYCAAGWQLADFLQGDYNTDKGWRFDEKNSTRECLDSLKELGIGTNGRIGGVPMHYEKLESRFTPGQILHNFNNSDYRVAECFTDRNLLVQDLHSGNYAVAIGAAMYRRTPKEMENAKGIVGVEWDHGLYLPNVLSAINFTALKEKYGAPPKEEAHAREDGRFDVEIKEVLSRVEPIEADTLGEAIDKAMDLYYSEQIVLDAADMKDVDFCEYRDNPDEKKTR